MSYYDCEIPEFYTESQHVARKQRRCCECKHPIKPGDSYVSCRGKSNGYFWHVAQHIHCYHFARYVNLEALITIEDGMVQCIPFGEIRSTISECRPQRPELMYMYDAMHAGINEVFSEGSGI